MSRDIRNKEIKKKWDIGSDSLEYFLEVVAFETGFEEQGRFEYVEI